MISKTIHTKKGSVTLIEPGIIKFSVKENVEWTLPDAKETHRANLKLSNGGKFCVYMNVSHFFIPTREAQLFATSKECTDYRVAAAFVVKNAGVKIFANLFVKFLKSKAPTRLFTTEKEAMAWMRKRYNEAVNT